MTADVMPVSGVLLMVVLGVAVGIVVGAMLLCLISRFTRRSLHTLTAFTV